MQEDACPPPAGDRVRILYLDCFSGIAGDMLLGALIDLGVRLEDLQEKLKTLPLRG